MHHRSISLCLAVAATAALSAVARAGDVDYAKFAAEKSEALVTVKCLIKLQMGGMMAGMGDQENEADLTGVLVSADGLVLCSNTQLGGFAGMMRRFMGPMAGDITATPTDIKVVVGEEQDELEADLIARDSELDLAWLRIKETGGRTFPYLDLTKGAEVAVGDKVMTVTRMGKYFGRSVVVGEGTVGGVCTKPRRLYVPTSLMRVGMGLPVYTGGGQLVGVVVVQMPEAEDADDPMSMATDLFSDMQDLMGGFILPAETVAKATEQALAGAKEKPAAPAEPEGGDEEEAEEP